MEEILEPHIGKTLNSLEDRISKLHDSLNVKNDELLEIKLSLINLQSSMKGLMGNSLSTKEKPKSIDKKDNQDAKSKLKSILKDTNKVDFPAKTNKLEVKDVFQKVRKINHIITGKKVAKVQIIKIFLYLNW
jgi:hypothetical protein